MTRADATGPASRATRVCIVAEAVALGGVEAHTLALAEMLVARGHEVVLVSTGPFDHREALRGQPWYSRVRVLRPPLTVNATDPAALAAWDRTLRDIESPVIILERGNFRMGSVPFLRVCRRVFGRMYGFDHLEADPLPRVAARRVLGIPMGLGLWWYRQTRGVRTAASLFDLTIAVSQAVKRRLVEDWGVAPRRIVVVPNGVRWTTYARDEARGRQWRRAHDVSEDTFVFGMLVRLTYWKAIHVAVRALATAIARDPQRRLQLVVAGSGEDRASLEQLVRDLDVTAHVRFLGHVPDSRLVLSAYDVILFSSIREGLPFGLLEGMAAGCVPIVTNISGMPEAVSSREIGWVVSANDVEALASAMLAAAATEPAQLAEMRRAAVAQIRTSHDLDARHARICDLMGL